MAKAKKAPLTPAAIRAAQMLARMRTVDPNSVIVGGSRSRLAGIPIPLALEYLFDVNILPMGLVIHLYGEKDNNKTTFFWELARLCMAYGGWPELFLTEGKYSPDLISAIVGYIEENPFLIRYVHEFDDMQAWQAALLTSIKTQRESFQKGNKADGVPPGAFSPICYGIDSLTGQLLKSTGEKMDTEGAAERGFALEAGSLTKYLKKLANEITDMPAIVVAINHMKVTPGNTPYEVHKRTIGGSQVKFQATYELELRQGPLVTEVDTNERHGFLRKGYDIRITTDKNSLGEKRRSVLVPLRWYYEDTDFGDRVQRMYFDWDAALTFAIMDMTGGNTLGQGAKAALQGKIDKIVHLRALNRNAYISKTFGYTKESPASPSVIGHEIAQRPEIVEALRDGFGIKRYTVWDPSEQCYFKLTQQLRGEIQKLLRSTPIGLPAPLPKGAAVLARMKADAKPVTKPVTKPATPPSAPVEPTVPLQTGGKASPLTPGGKATPLTAGAKTKFVTLKKPASSTAAAKPAIKPAAGGTTPPSRKLTRPQ